MKLLYVCEATEGGISEYAIRQSRALSDAGIEVKFLCRPGFPIERIERVEILPTLPALPQGRGVLNRLGDGRKISKVVTIEARKSSTRSVLFACYAEYFAPVWAPVLRRLIKDGITIGTIAHDPVRDFVLGPLWWHRWSVREGYSFVNHVFVHDDTPVDFGGPKPHGISTHIIPHGSYEVNSPRLTREALRHRWGYPDKARVFLSFGHIRDGKNLDIFLRALRDAPEEVKLLVAGSGGGGSQRPPSFYQEMAEELGVAGRCHWDLRHIPDEEVGDLFAVADVVLLTYSAKFRSASGVLNAAVACRKPVLASSGAGPLRGVVETYQLGVYIPPDDTEKMAEGIAKILATNSDPQWKQYEQENSWQENAKRVIEALALEMPTDSSTAINGPEPPQ